MSDKHLVTDFSCPDCAATLEPYDGGEAYNYELYGIWTCPQCGEAWNEDELSDIIQNEFNLYYGNGNAQNGAIKNGNS